MPTASGPAAAGRHDPCAAYAWGQQRRGDAWREGRSLGFGRATSDGWFRAVLLDVVWPRQAGVQGLGAAIVEELLHGDRRSSGRGGSNLMTTQGAGFLTSDSYFSYGPRPKPCCARPIG